jgi:hypothetical protein
MRIQTLLLVLGVLGGLTLQALNSFNMAVSRDVDAARILSVVTGPHYQRTTPVPMRDNILVVLFDEASVQALSESDDGWRLRTLGPSYGDQRALIRAAADAGAAAVFVDITYTRRVEADYSGAFLAEAAEDAARAGTPVFFGPISEQTPLGRAEGARSVVDVAWRGNRDDIYALHGVNDRPIAALALYRAACAATDRLRVNPNCAPALTDPSGSDADRSMAVTWGRGVAPDYKKYWSSDSVRACQVSTSVWSSVGESLRGFLSSFFNETIPDPVRLERGRCPYHLAIPGNIAVSAQETGAYDALKAEMKGRVVLIGAALRGSSDYVEAPGVGLLPGVFQHAMALDNLMTFGDRYKRKAPSLWHELDLGDLAELFLAVVAAVLIGQALRWRPDAKPAEKRVRVAAAVIVPLALTLGAASFAYIVMNWAAGDIFGVLATSIAAAFALAPKEPWERILDARVGVRTGLVVIVALLVLAAAARLLLTWVHA